MRAVCNWRKVPIILGCLSSADPARGRTIPIFRSLRYPNYRRYYLGQLVSLNGTWMQNVAQAWLVYRLTESSFMLGLVAFCSLVPVLVLSLYGGVLADRVDRWRLLVGAHIVGMLQALALAALTLSGVVAPWHIIGLALVLGSVHALEMPARHSFIAEMVPRENLPNAIALNSSAFNVARFVGPALAGWLVALVGEGWVFVLNALSFVAILSALASMQRVVRAPVHGHGSAWSRIREAIGFAGTDVTVRAGLLMVAMMSLVASSITVLMPVFAREVFGGGAEVLGVLLGAMGVGSLLGAVRLAHRASAEGLERMIGASGVVAGGTLAMFSSITDVGLGLPLLTIIGFCQTTLVAAINTLIQLRVPDALRGRTMSLFSMVFIGLMPVGSITAGALAQHLDVAATSRLFAALGILGSGVFLVRVAGVERRGQASAGHDRR